VPPRATSPPRTRPRTEDLADERAGGAPGDHPTGARPRGVAGAHDYGPRATGGEASRRCSPPREVTRRLRRNGGHQRGHHSPAPTSPGRSPASPNARQTPGASLTPCMVVGAVDASGPDGLAGPSGVLTPSWPMASQCSTATPPSWSAARYEQAWFSSDGPATGVRRTSHPGRSTPRPWGTRRRRTHQLDQTVDDVQLRGVVEVGHRLPDDACHGLRLTRGVGPGLPQPRMLDDHRSDVGEETFDEVPRRSTRAGRPWPTS
jgi:hypothetical protein